ncbi:MAG: chemotaxis protein CheX, partial [Vallitaleaceae bacterium]|nr:chemotaxis protein CheX [Vallitaleaceae bacterium]
ELEAQNATLEERSSSLKFINSAYSNRTLKLQNLLNNVGQGFLTISKDQTINPEYSFECEKMILSEHVKKISGMKITDTLFANSNQEEFLHDLIAKIFESDASQKELFLSLMPEELCLNERVLNIQYKLVSDEQQEEVLLIILTDITHTRNLEKQMDEERNNLNMIVKVLLNRGEFIDLVMDYKEFAKKDFHSILEQQKEELLRDIHTYKGSFSQYYLNNTSTFLNELENALYASDGLDQIHIINSSEILDHLESDMETIESYVGQDFLYSDDIYTVKEEKILEIENKIKRILSPSEYQKILPIVKSIRYKSIRELLKTYPDYTMKLSERQSKSIHPVTIDGDDIYIDHLIYQNFSKTLIHMFRNCVDHGIETEDERIELDKPQIATIHCHVETLDEGFTITISDDGRGIDTARLLQIGLNKGLIQEEDIPHMTDEEILSTVFLDGLTTRETVSAISGRGVGLAAVKESVVALGGKISVQSTPGSGTEFKIWLPNLHSTALLTTSPERLLQHIVNASGTVFKSLNLNVADYKFIRTDKIMLNKISALISIKGSLDAILIISVDDVLGKKLVSAFMIDDVDDEQIDSYIEDVLGEISNTILGNVLGLFEEDGVFLSIGVPAMISNKDAYVKYTESQIYSIVFDQEMYSLTMSLLLLDPDHQCIHEADGLPCFFEDVTDFAK